MFDFVLKIFLFLSPIFWFPYNGWMARYQFFQFGYFSSSNSLVQLQFFQYGTVVLFLTAMFSKPQRHFKDKYAGFLFLMFILGVLWHPKAIVNFYNILTGFLLYYLVVVYSKNVKSILEAVVGVAFLNSIWAVLQSFGINLIYNPAYDDAVGLMTYKTHLGIYQALAVPICYIFNPWLSIVPLIGLLLSNSFTAAIPVIIGMVYFSKDKIVKLRSMPIFMLFISCLVVFSGKMFYKLSLRFEVWIETLKMISQNYFYGHGIGVFEYVDLNTGNHGIPSIKYSDPYSIYLQTFYALGVFGLIALVLFFYKKLNFKPEFLISKGLFSSCLILVIVGLCYSFMDYPRLVGTTIALFGLLTVIKGDHYDKNSIQGRAVLS